MSSAFTDEMDLQYNLSAHYHNIYGNKAGCDATLAYVNTYVMLGF